MSKEQNMSAVCEAIAGAFLVLVAGCARPVEQKGATQYATWPVWEVDRAASIWLIKRYVEPDAEFVFVNKGDSLDGFVPFDTPEAELRRQHNLACYQVILNKCGINDSRLTEIGRYVWDVEINYWGEKKFEGSTAFKEHFDTIFGLGLCPEETLKRCFVELDALVAE